MNSLIRGAFLCALCTLAFKVSAVSAAILYGDFDDIPPGVVMYTDVTESSSTDPVPPPRFGAPTITENTLDFDPKSFGASATNGSPSSDIFDGQLNFGFMLHPQASGGLNGIVLRESGDFDLFGSGTSVTSVGAGIFAEVEITHVNNVQLVSPITVVGSTQFSADLVSSPGLTQPWGNVLLVDFGPALSNAGFGPDDYATKGEVVIDDTLVAVSEFDPSTIATIIKKDFKVIPTGKLITNEVPEPATVLLAAFALVACSAVRRGRAA